MVKEQKQMHAAGSTDDECRECRQLRNQLIHQKAPERAGGCGLMEQSSLSLLTSTLNSLRTWRVDSESAHEYPRQELSVSEFSLHVYDDIGAIIA